MTMHEATRRGYKQTELGVIPEDWEVRRLSEHFTIYAGGDVPKHPFSRIRTKISRIQFLRTQFRIMACMAIQLKSVPKQTH